MVVVSSAFSAPVEGIILQQPSTKLLINDQELGTATLYITESNVIWGGGVTSSGTPAPTICLLYPNISLHAVQRLPTPTLYMILNYDLRVPGLNGEQSGQDDADIDDDFDPEETPITQLRFVPQNEADLQTMYSAMSQGQALHPDAADVEDDEPYMDGEEFDEYISGDDEFEDAEESESGAGDDAAARLRQLRLENANGHHQGMMNPWTEVTKVVARHS